MFQSNEGKISGVCRGCSKLRNVLGGCHCNGTCSACGLIPNYSGGCGCTRSSEPNTIPTAPVDTDEISNNWMDTHGYNWENIDSLGEESYGDGGENN